MTAREWQTSLAPTVSFRATVVLDCQVPLLIHVCGHLSELLSSVERFDIRAFPRLSMEGDEMDMTIWLELFRPIIDKSCPRHARVQAAEDMDNPFR